MPANFEQTQQILKKANKIGVILPSEVNIDLWSATSALSFWAQSQQKDLQVISDAKNIPQLQFLSKTPVIQSSFGTSDQFQIKVSTNNNTLKELSYNLEPNGVVINLKSEPGLFSAEDISYGSVSQNYDALVFLGVKNLDSLQKLYSDNTDIFFNSYKINIDTNPANEYFGNENLVDILATSVSEIVSQLLSPLTSQQNEQQSTALLAGIISQTHSFRDPKTSPKTLSIAAGLIESGAKQPEIIQYLYKTKNFSILKLWGRALARIIAIPEIKTIHTTLTKVDFEKTGETKLALPGVMKDILENVSNYNLAVLVAEQDEGSSLLLAGLPHISLQDILSGLKLPHTEPIPLLGAYEFVAVHGIKERPDVLIEKVEQSVKKILNA